MSDETPDASSEDSVPGEAAASDSQVPTGEAVDALDAEVVDAPTAEAEVELSPAEQVLAAVTKERDDYLDGMRRLQAEFENYRKAVAKRETSTREMANHNLVAELLPILDACDGAVDNAIEGVEPIRASLLDALAKQGLERIDPTDAPFDPEFHEAVLHEPGEGDGEPVVSAVLRVGYAWKGRTLRAAMVQVSG